MASEAQVLEALKGVIDPELNLPLTELGMVKKVEIVPGAVNISIDLTIPGCPLKDTLQRDINKAVAPLGFLKVNVYFGSMTPEQLEALKARLGAERSSKINSYSASGKTGTEAGGINRLPKKVPHLIAISSGKGGVGKSSVTSQLAMALVREGKKVGILDADITGPSIARIFGVSDRPFVEGKDTLIPVPSKSGVKILSMNLLISDEKAPVIWRGPLINGAIRQLYLNAKWEGHDYLLVDMPPGTSDATLTVFQSLPLDGCIIVSSPQALVSMIVEKSIGMARILKIPILGVIENLAYIELPGSKEPYYLFGKLKAEAMAKSHGIPYLGALPINPALADACDAGTIETMDAPIFREMAKRIIGGEVLI
jgi:ATP-binding protein involved in chromosome partitioning